MLKKAMLFAAASLMAASAAQATTYVGFRSFGTSSIGLSITTDGTTGVLTTANIVDWTLDLNEDGTLFTLDKGNSEVFVEGTALSATATQLLFDFDWNLASYAFLHIQYPFIGSSQQIYCAQTDLCFDNGGPGEGLDAGGDAVHARVTRSGLFVLGTAVPEPASWAMMIAGMAAVGGALRTRRTSLRFT